MADKLVEGESVSSSSSSSSSSCICFGAIIVLGCGICIVDPVEITDFKLSEMAFKLSNSRLSHTKNQS